MKYFSFDFLQSFKNVKIIFSSWAIQKQVVDWIWLVVHSLPTPSICDNDFVKRLLNSLTCSHSPSPLLCPTIMNRPTGKTKCPFG